MRPIRVVQTGAGTGAPMILDRNGLPQVSLQVDVTGTVNYTVQQTVDDLFNTAITPVWINHPDTNLVAASTSIQGNYAYVPMATRIVVNSGSGSAAYTVQQSGIRG